MDISELKAASKELTLEDYVFGKQILVMYLWLWLDTSVWDV